MSRWTPIARQLRPDARLFALGFLVAPLPVALTVAQPWILRSAIDVAVANRDGSLLVELACLWLAAAVIGFAAETAYTLSLSVAASRSITRLRAAVFEHALSLGQSFHDREPTGRLLTRVTSDVEAIGETLTAGAITIVLDVLVVLGIVVAMAVMDWRLTAVLLLVGPPLALAIEGIRREMRRLFLKARTTFAELVAFASERITGIEVVQLYADEERSLRKFEERLAPYREASVVSNVWDALLFSLVDGTSSITMALMLGYGASPWLEGVVTAGLLAAFVDAIGKLFLPIRELSNKLATLQRAASALEKLGELLARDEKVADGEHDLPDLPGPVELHDVRFAYGGGPDVLHGVSLAIRPGEVVAIVGRTGSGKTTIGKLLVRTHDGYRGSIRIDGLEHTSVRREALRRRVAVVQQDVVLFPADVRFNLTLGAPISDERLREAITLAQAEPVVERLGGLDGRVAHHGRNLSQGEAQLLAFARVLARDCPLVILDEATASVDSLTEARIQAATQVLLDRRTVLVVAHRLSTVRHADRVIVLDAGRVVEAGPPDELLARGGAYAALFHAQFTSLDPSGTVERAEGTG